MVPEVPESPEFFQAWHVNIRVAHALHATWMMGLGGLGGHVNVCVNVLAQRMLHRSRKTCKESASVCGLTWKTLDPMKTCEQPKTSKNNLSVKPVHFAQQSKPIAKTCKNHCKIRVE